MNPASQLLFLLSAFGALNSLFLSIYFATQAKKKRFSNYFLTLLLLVLSARILKSSFYYFSPRLAAGYIQFGLTACSLVGPFLFLYILSQIKGTVERIVWAANTLPYLLIMIYLGVQFPYWQNRVLWSQTIVPAIYGQWLIYILITGFYLRNLIRKLFQKQNRLEDIKVWILNIFFGVVIIWFAYVIGSFTSYIVGALSFSFVFYLFILLWLFKTKKNSLFYEDKVAYENKSLDAAILEKIENQLPMVREKELYKNPDIKLSDIADELNVSTHVLSQYLNDNLGKSFSLFLNEYRIEEAKRLLKSNSKFTIEAIGYESGFNTKSTFFTVFKKLTGFTPAKYRNQV